MPEGKGMEMSMFSKPHPFGSAKRQCSGTFLLSPRFVPENFHAILVSTCLKLIVAYFWTGSNNKCFVGKDAQSND